MKEGPNIASIAALVGDPARANMLTALMDGRALTATELAHEASVAPSTASSHLAKLEAAKLITLERQGRHRYFRLSGEDVASTLEALMGLAARTGHLRARTGPRDPALRHARVCYDHLAGELSVRMYDRLRARGLLSRSPDGLYLTKSGQRFFSDFGIDLEPLARGRRPLCRACLDWSERRSHLGGALGASLLQRLYELRWAKRVGKSRVVAFTPNGERRFSEILT